MVNCDSCGCYPVCNLLKGVRVCQYYKPSLNVMLNRILKSVFIAAIGILGSYYIIKF